jgi:hypothetical protein
VLFLLPQQDLVPRTHCACGQLTFDKVFLFCRIKSSDYTWHVPNALDSSSSNYAYSGKLTRTVDDDDLHQLVRDANYLALKRVLFNNKVNVNLQDQVETCLLISDHNT